MNVILTISTIQHPCGYTDTDENQPSDSNRILRRTFWMITGLKTFNCWIITISSSRTGREVHTSNCPLAPATLTAVWFPITCAATIVNASHWVGLTFPGIILLPGSFSGRLNSPSPQRGPEPRYRMSFAIFINEQAITLSAPWVSTRASWAAKASNWVKVITFCEKAWCIQKQPNYFVWSSFEFQPS